VAPDGSEPFEIRASVVVNAAGVWADEVRALEEHGDPRSIRPAKGIHITVPNAAFPCDIAAVIPVKEDHRSIFVVSWGDQVYLGTTDTEYDGPLDDPACLPEDIDYILGAANAVTTRPIGRADITGLWTGLRPLLAPVEGRHAPSERTADLSRRHTVRTSAGGVVTVTGGKLTTYRKMAEDTVDAVAAQLGRRSLRCATKDLRLRGAGQTSRVPARRVDIRDGEPEPPDHATATAAHLAGRYGSETPEVLALADGRPELLDPLVEGLHYLQVEAVYAVRHEMAGSVADVLDRRTRSSLRDARGAAAAARRVAGLIGPELGWDGARIEAEAAAYAETRHGELARAGLDPAPLPSAADAASTGPGLTGPG
jgi:glycerol-3-phosphate dehydrogenase